MGCKIYINKFNISYGGRGRKKRFETENGRSVLEYALRDTYALDLSALETETGEHGKPFFKDRRDIRFNISHSEGYAAAAVCEREVGVDIQVVREVREGVITKLCDETELMYVNGSADRSRAFIQLWALKESYIKAIGLGMSFPMDKINFDIRGCDGGSALVGRFSNREGLFLLRDFGEFVLAACVLDE